MKRLVSLLRIYRFLFLLKLVPLLERAISRLRGGIVAKNAIRTTEGSLDLATVTYADARGREVVLIGMQHVADAQFFRDVAAALDREEAAGSAILYEDVRSPTDEQYDGLSEEDAAILRAFEGVFTEQAAMAASSGLVHQMDALPPRDSWTRSDIDILEMIGLIRRHGLERCLGQYLGAADADASVPDGPNPFAELLTDFQFRHAHVMELATWLGTLRPKARKLRRLILDRRNEVAVECIRQALISNRRVAAIWGVAHLPGIGRLLKRDGFSVTEVTWNTAYRFKRFESAPGTK